MKRYILLWLTAVSLFALMPADSKADEFRVYVDPGNDRTYYRDDGWYYRHHRHADEYYWRRWHRHHHHHDYDGDRDRDR
jgi:hypothetical protein